MKALSDDELRTFFKAIESEYDVRLPVCLHDGTRTIGKLDDGNLSLCGGTVPGKITSVFFPQLECMLRVNSDGIQMQQPVSKPLLVAGLTAADADCLEFVDRFFGTTYRDNIYFNKRDNAAIFCISGWCDSNGRFMKITGGNCDVELIFNKSRYVVKTYSEIGRALAKKMPSGISVSQTEFNKLHDVSQSLPRDDEELIQKASKLITAGKVPQEFWQEISDRCIACTACNLACPTCTCFDVFDQVASGHHIQRWRLWDSCQLEGFAREASGHNPMGQEDTRTHRRIHHKLAADVVRWGHVTCFGCGRCDQVCPTGIGIKAVCREIIKRFNDTD
jgi:sulfhydrogenase subunit beta (sulfur reductase)